MTTQDNLNNASELGRTIASLIAHPDCHLSANARTVRDNLVAAMAAKAHDLLNPPAIKAASSPSDEIFIGANDHATITGSGEVTITPAQPDMARPGLSTSYRVAGDGSGVGPTCDCACSPCEHSFPVTMSAPIRLLSQDLTRYLSEAFRQGNIDHAVRVVTARDGQAEFYIRPMNADGETVQFSAYTTNVNA